MKSFVKTALPFLSLCLLASCNESLPDSKKNGGMTQNEEIMPDGSNINGIYAADLWPVNYNLHFKKVGAAGVTREGDNFSASVMMKYGPADTRHRQAIYTGRRCPNLTDDLNKDAYIDILEAKLAIGSITIPLDGDLDSQMGGREVRALGDTGGKFFYQRSASFERMFADLKTPDEMPGDNVIKLGADDGLTFPGRVLIVHGLTEKVPLPESVATTDGETAHESIPVACAVLWKVPEMPAELKPESNGLVIQ